MSGTSMASPHVAGAAALLKADNPSASPASIRSSLINNGSTSGWTGDRDSTKEPLINTANGGTTPPPPPPPTTTVDAQAVSVSAPANVTRGSSATVTVNVRNNGTASATIPVALSETPGGVAQSKSVNLAAGASGNVSFTWSTTSSTATGSHTFTATTSLAGDSNAGNNTATGTTNVTAPVTPAMSVASLTLTSSPYGRYARLTSQVKITANGANVSSATVRLEFTYPTGQKYSQLVRTGSTGVATVIRTVSTKGNYTVTVTAVTRSGMTYDPSGNVVTSRSVIVP
jgi:hypothetical protein